MANPKEEKTAPPAKVGAGETETLVPAGYLLHSGMTDPELGGMSGAILAGVWFGFAFVVSTLFNAVREFERWANRG